MTREELEARGWKFTVKTRKDGKCSIRAVVKEPDGGKTDIRLGHFRSEEQAFAELLPDVAGMEEIRSNRG